MDAERLRLHVAALCERIIQDIEREHEAGVDRSTLETHKLTLARLEALCGAYRVLADNNEGGQTT